MAEVLSCRTNFRAISDNFKRSQCFTIIRGSSAASVTRALATLGVCAAHVSLASP